MRPRPIRQVRQTSEDHVSGHSDCKFPACLRFRNLGFADMADLAATCNAPVPIYPKGLAFKFVPPFLEGHRAFVCDQDLAPTETRICQGRSMAQAASCMRRRRRGLGLIKPPGHVLSRVPQGRLGGSAGPGAACKPPVGSGHPRAPRGCWASSGCLGRRPSLA